TFDQLLERTPSIEPRTRAASIPAFANPVRFFGRADARLQIRQLHLFPEPVDDVVDLELQHELDFAFVLSARALLARSTLTLRSLQNVARLRSALAGTLLLLRFAQTEVIVLEHAHRNAHGLRRVVDDIGARNDLREVLAHGVAHFLVVAQPVACAT